MLSGYYPPEVRSAAQLIYELAHTLAAREHHVSVVTTFPPTRAEVAESARAGLSVYRGRFWLREQDGLVNVIRMATLPFNKVPVAVRSIGHFALAASLFAGAVMSGRPDVVWMYSPPLTLGLVGMGLQWLWGTPYVASIQDLHPQALVDLGLLRSPTAIRLFEWMEQLVYRHAARIVVHSEGNRQEVRKRGVPMDRVVVVPNWVDTTAFLLDSRREESRKRHAPGSRFIVLFAGVMGYAQDLEVILRAADRLRQRHEIQFLLVGDGVCKADAEIRAVGMGLPNMRFLPLVPGDVYPEVVAAADVCLVTLRPEVRTPVIPSKVLGIMAGARPIVAALPHGNDAIQLIDEAECGICVRAGDDVALAEAVERLCDEPDLGKQMGARGRRFAESHLDRGLGVERCEQVMRSAVEARDYSARTTDHPREG